MKESARWTIAPIAPEAFLRSMPSYPPQLLQVLFNRGVRKRAAVEDFLAPPGLTRLPDPFLYTDMEEAIERLTKARRNKERVVVYGDFDPDGACGAAILAELLGALGISHSVYLPDRVTEGHGLSARGVEEIVARNASLVLTVDCGASNISEIAALCAKGIETIVLDHHLVSETLPPAVAVIDAQRPDDRYPFDWLCGAGVAFAFADAVSRKPIGKALPEDFLVRLLDLVAIGTIADLVPLRDANRILVGAGMAQLRKTPRVGLRALIAAARLDPEALETEDVAFDLGPRLNAASRMDHANTAYALLRADAPDEAEKLARTLDRHNRARQKRVAEITNEVETELTADERLPEVIVAAKEGWSSTVISGVASRIVERKHRPVFIFEIRGGRAVGSARSVPGFDLVAAMRACGGRELFEAFGGHAMAAGCTLRADWLPILRERMEAYALTVRVSPAISGAVEADLEIRAHEATPELYSWFERLAPFGKENPRPRVLLRELEVLETRAVGRGGNGMKLRLADRRTGKVVLALARNGNSFPVLRVGDRVNVIGELRHDSWRGRRDVILRPILIEKC